MTMHVERVGATYCSCGHLHLYRLIAGEVVDASRGQQVVEVLAAQDLKKHRHRIGVREGLFIGREVSALAVKSKV